VEPQTSKVRTRQPTSRDIVYSHLPGSDQDDLVWFFGQGQCTFERSVLGYQLRRAELYSFGSRMCPRCKGSGLKGKDQEQIIREAIATIEAMSPQELQRLRDSTRGLRGKIPEWYDDGRCKFCDGFGWVPRDRKHKRVGALTACPTVGELRPVPEEPQSDDLERYGFVSDQLQRLDDREIQTLAAFFGSAGSRNEHDKDRGRIFGVYALTPAGKKLLKMAGKEGRLTPPLRIENLATVQLTQYKPNRGELLKAARQQAESRLREAETEWKACRPRGGRKRLKGPRRLETLADIHMVSQETSEAFRELAERIANEELPCAV